jgi:hypothetical protein
MATHNSDALGSVGMIVNSRSLRRTVALVERVMHPANICPSHEGRVARRQLRGARVGSFTAVRHQECALTFGFEQRESPRGTLALPVSGRRIPACARPAQIPCDHTVSDTTR